MSQDLLEKPAPPATEPPRALVPAEKPAPVAPAPVAPAPVTPAPAPAARTEAAEKGPVATKTPPRRRPIDIPEDDETLFERFKVPIILTGLVGLITTAFIVLKPDGDSPPPKKRAAEEPMVRITPLPTPPPPPPPPPPKIEQPKMEEKMLAEEKPEDEPVPDEPAPQPTSEPLAGYKGSGTDGYGATAGRGNGSGRNTIGSRQARSRFGWYAGQVQNTIADALRRHGKVKTASLTVDALIWSDATGRITRSRLKSSTGDRSLDAAITDEVLTGLQLKEPPPAGMPMPINLRLTARRQ